MSGFDDTQSAAIEAAFGSRSEPAAIIRGGVENSIDAMPGRRVVEGQNLDGFTSETLQAVWIVRAADYTFDTESETPTPVEPVEDDQFKITKNGRIKTYDVTPPVQDEPAWRFMDTGETFIRLNLKLISNEAE